MPRGDEPPIEILTGEPGQDRGVGLLARKPQQAFQRRPADALRLADLTEPLEDGLGRVHIAGIDQRLAIPQHVDGQRPGHRDGSMFGPGIRMANA